MNEELLVNGEPYVWCEQHGKLEPRAQEQKERDKRIPTKIWP